MDVLRQLTKAQLTLTLRLPSLQVVETKGHVAGDGPQPLQDKVGQRMAGKQGEDPEQMVTHQERIPRERHQTLLEDPLRVLYGWIGRDGVRAMGSPLLRNEPNRELSYGHTGICPTSVNVNPCTGLQLQDTVRSVEGPDPGTRRIQVPYDGLYILTCEVS